LLEGDDVSSEGAYVEHPIDQLAKNMASGTVPRRQILKSIGAGAAGSLFVLITGSHAKAQNGAFAKAENVGSGQRLLYKKCSTNLDCTPGSFYDGRQLNGQCCGYFSRDCCHVGQRCESRWYGGYCTY
jgi:hypothetical protein